MVDRQQVETIPYSQFEEMIDSGKIQSVRATDKYITGALKETPPDGRKRFVTGASFRKWLIEQGCHIDGHEHLHGHEGPVMVTVHREGRTTRVPLGGSHKALGPRIVRRACEELGLDPLQLPGPKSRV